MSIKSRRDTTALYPRSKDPGEYTFHVSRSTFHVRGSYIRAQERNQIKHVERGTWNAFLCENVVDQVGVQKIRGSS